MTKNPGKFIVIDGTDGSGKTTQFNLLKQKLIAEGYSVEVADFPQYNTKSAGPVEEYLSGKYGGAEEVGPYKASIFYAVDRYDASFKIRSWLNEGKIVLSNRYVSANMGHQGGKIHNPLERRVFFNWLDNLEYKVFNIPRPDLSIILHVEAAVSQKLAKQRAREDWNGKTRDIHEEDIEHLKRAEQVYLEIARSYPGFQLIKCTKNNEIMGREEIHFQVWLHAKRLLENRGQSTGKGFDSLGDILIKNGHFDNLAAKEEASPASQAPENLPVSSAAENTSPQTDGRPTIIPVKEEHICAEAKNIAAVRISERAKLPSRAHADDAGLDLYADDYHSIPPYQQSLVGTGVRLAIPRGFAGLIWDKSGIANQGIATMGGVIDASYRGEIKVVVKNLSEDIYNIAPGQKIAQLLIQKVALPVIEEEKNLDQTERAEKGFGSTGQF